MTLAEAYTYQSESGFASAVSRRRAALVVVFFAFFIVGGENHAFGQTHATWSDYGGGPDASQYSALREINRTNVNKLQVAWTFSTADDNRYFFNPIEVHGLTYVLAENNSIVALDAKTGKEVWAHPADPHTDIITDRGINYWESKDGRDRRLLFASNHFLQEIDARTGKSILFLGTNGRINLKEGLGRDPATLSLVQSTTPGRIFENLLILGSATNEGYGSAPGDVRAFDVRTRATWYGPFTPSPIRAKLGTKPGRRTPGNGWEEPIVGAKSLPTKSMEIVYVHAASPKYNFYGADRLGANLFGDCLLALDARTGKLLWYFQMVHHDIWDYDNTAAPKLLTVWHDGRQVDAVAQTAKTGFVWVFDRVTGKPLWPVEERPEPRSDMPGEETWPTQPFPLAPPPFARQAFTTRDLSTTIGDAQEHARFREEMDAARNEGLYTPPSLEGRLKCPATAADRTGAPRQRTRLVARFTWFRWTFPACLNWSANRRPELPRESRSNSKATLSLSRIAAYATATT